MKPVSQDQLKTDYHASREFLLESPIVPEHRVRYHPPNEIQTASLKTAFTQMKTGDNFIADAVEKLGETFIFGALAVKIDEIKPDETKPDETKPGKIGPGNRHPGPSVPDHLTRLAGVIDAIAAEASGIWGLIYEGILGLFVPDRDIAGYQDLARTIRERAGQQFNETLSIGIAGYPTDHFPRSQIMENALKALDHAAFLGPDTTVEFDAVSLNISGDRLYARGDIEGSITEFEHALRLDPANVNLHNSLGVCYGILNQYDQALAEFEAAIRLAPGEVMAVYNYGLVMLLTDHPNRALDNFLQAEQVRDDIFEVIFHIGKVYLQLGQPEKGMAYFKKALALNPDTSSVYRLAGQCHLQMENEDEAVAAYTQAVRLNDTDAEALSALGHLYDLRNENLEIAILFCERSIQIDPKNGCYHYRLGRLYQKDGRLDDAIVAFKNAIARGYDSQTDLTVLKDQINGDTESTRTMNPATNPAVKVAR